MSEFESKTKLSSRDERHPTPHGVRPQEQSAVRYGEGRGRSFDLMKSPRMIAQRKLMDGWGASQPAHGVRPQEQGAVRYGDRRGPSFDLMKSPRMIAQRKSIDGWSASQPVQRYKKVGSNLVSGNLKYVLDENDRNTLHANQNADGPKPDGAFENNGTRTFSPKELGLDAENPDSTFNSFKGIFKLGDKLATNNPNDCGMYANALARGLGSWSNETLIDGIPGRRSGLSTPVDRFRSAQTPEDKDAVNRDRYDVEDPDNRESYLEMNVGDVFELYFDQVESKALKESGECPHHAAAVVAVDGKDQITHEANAGLEIDAGQFFMYGDAKEQQFYTKNIGGFDWSKVQSSTEGFNKHGVLDRLIRK